MPHRQKGHRHLQLECSSWIGVVSARVGDSISGALPLGGNASGSFVVGNPKSVESPTSGKSTQPPQVRFLYLLEKVHCSVPASCEQARSLRNPLQHPSNCWSHQAPPIARLNSAACHSYVFGIRRLELDCPRVVAVPPWWVLMCHCRPAAQSWALDSPFSLPALSSDVNMGGLSLSALACSGSAPAPEHCSNL